jgi:hypothetical protein
VTDYAERAFCAEALFAPTLCMNLTLVRSKRSPAAPGLIWLFGNESAPVVGDFAVR